MNPSMLHLRIQDYPDKQDLHRLAVAALMRIEWKRKRSVACDIAWTRLWRLLRITEEYRDG